MLIHTQIYTHQPHLLNHSICTNILTTFSTQFAAIASAAFPSPIQPPTPATPASPSSPPPTGSPPQPPHPPKSESVLPGLFLLFSAVIFCSLQWLLPTIWSFKFLHRHFLRLLHVVFPHGSDGGGGAFDGTLPVAATAAAGGVMALVFVLWGWGVVAVIGRER
jgi:hypothetical protein